MDRYVETESDWVVDIKRLRLTDAQTVDIYIHTYIHT